MTKINSHIQMPKCVLKNFMDNSERLYYYSFETQNINYGRAASLIRNQHIILKKLKII